MQRVRSLIANSPPLGPWVLPNQPMSFANYRRVMRKGAPDTEVGLQPFHCLVEEANLSPRAVRENVFSSL